MAVIVRSKEALIERLKSNHVAASATAENNADNEVIYTYRINSICLPGGTTALSYYVIGGKFGYFRQDNCGSENAGSLSLVAEVTLEDADYGTFPGWIYNSHLANPPRSYFFSKEEAFPHELPGMYLVCQGKPYKEGDPVDYDIFGGLGATRS